MNVNELRDYKLTLDEWSLLPGIAARHMTYERKQAQVDMLVLAGLVEHTDAESLALTPDGEAAAAAIDMIFDSFTDLERFVSSKGWDRTNSS